MNEFQVDNLRNTNSGTELAGTVKMEVKEDDVLLCLLGRVSSRAALCLSGEIDVSLVGVLRCNICNPLKVLNPLHGT